MGLHSFLVMATPRKENKRCHLTTGQTPNEKKRNRPRGHIQEHISSRKSLDYDSVEQTNKSPSPCIRGVLQRSIVVTSRSPRKCLVKKYPWSDAEDRATVQFIAMHKDEQATDNEWPAMRSEAEYWSLAARYMKSSTGVQYLRKAQSIRQRVVNHLRKKFKTVEEAEDAYGITIDAYLADPEAQKENQVPLAGIPENVMDLVKKLTGCQLSVLATHIMEKLALPILKST